MKKSTFARLALLVVCFAHAAIASNPKEKEWAFLIFLNGHNNLAPYSDLNINQLETIGSTDKIDVIVQWAKLGFENTYRLKVVKDSDPEKVTSPFVETMPRQDMGDYMNLIEFVRWAKERYPAKRYFVSFWNHGSGWHRLDSHVSRGVSYDDYSGNHISTEQMGLAMREIAAIIGHKVDIVGADACLMGMAEVGSEMADSVEYFVASEDLEPGLGWPYHTFYERWAAKPEASSAEISTYLVEEYMKYLGSKEQITLSAFHVASLPLLWERLREVANTIRKLSTEELMALKGRTQTALAFAYPDYVDIGSWMKRADAMEHGPIPKSLLASVREVLGRMVVANGTTAKFADAEGIAFWVPPTKQLYEAHAERYAKLRFAKETGWHEVAAALVNLPVCMSQKSGQWATGVVGFSSQYSEQGWSAKQALGACDTANYGDNQTAWSPRENSGTDEFLTVSFATPVYSTGAVIRETMGSGFVTSIDAIDAQGAAHRVWEGVDPSVPGSISDFKVVWPRTPYLVNSLKVNLTTKKNPGTWTQVDSIQLLGTP